MTRLSALPMKAATRIDVQLTGMQLFIAADVCRIFNLHSTGHFVDGLLMSVVMERKREQDLTNCN